MRKMGWGLILAGVCLIWACILRPSLDSLDPESRDFLSKVRYLIGKDERTVFLGLNEPEDRKAFIENFWRKRDPDPDTEVNEFKIEYFARIDGANFLFKEGTTPGWMSERGRLYITLGPPENRVTYPRGVTFYGKPTEVWYYGFFPVMFVDDNWTGNYRLDPQSAAQIGEMTKTQVRLRPKVGSDSWMKDVLLEIQKAGPGEAIVLVKLPYKDIWLNLDGDRMTTTLQLSVEATDAAGARAWQEERSYPLSFSKDEFMKIRGETYLIKVPIKLPPGEYDLRLTLLNVFPGARIEKKAKLVL